MLHPDKLFGRLGNRMFQMAFIYAQMRKGLIPDIYLQDPKYFDEFREDIITLFGDGIGYIDKVAIHVRRGDYVNNSFYVDLTKTKYYYNAMQLFPGEKFMVFSDDIEWCKQKDVFKNCSFSEGHDEIKDLNLFASCKGAIIANSSFSWWGAYIGRIPKVIAPKEWYADKLERTKIPDSWIRI